MWGCGTEILSAAVAEVVGVSDKGGQRRRYQPRIPDCPPPPRHSNATGIRAIIWIRAGGSGWAVERQAAEVFRHAHARTGAGGGDQPLLTPVHHRACVCVRERASIAWRWLVQILCSISSETSGSGPDDVACCSNNNNALLWLYDSWLYHHQTGEVVSKTN